MKIQFSTQLAVSLLLLVMKLFWGKSLKIDKRVTAEHVVITIKVKRRDYGHHALADLILPLVKKGLPTFQD